MDILYYYCSWPTNNLFLPRGYDLLYDAITVFENGAVRLQRLAFGKDIPLREITTSPIPSLAEELKEVILKSEKRLNEMPSFLDNGEHDGYWQTFQFGSTKLTANNLGYYGEDDIEYMIYCVASHDYSVITSAEEAYRLADQSNFLVRLRSQIHRIIRNHLAS